MIAWNDASELKDAALGRQISLAAFAERERRVRRDFWAKLKRVIGMVPFAEDLVASYYCALDPATPMRVRGMLLAALAYFILPFDLIPDMLPVLGFADDAALLTAVFGLVAAGQQHGGQLRAHPRPPGVDRPNAVDDLGQRAILEHVAADA